MDPKSKSYNPDKNLKKEKKEKKGIYKTNYIQLSNLL